MSNWNLERCYRDLLIPASNALAIVESNGVMFDSAKAIELRETEVNPAIERHTKEIHRIVGQEINPGSTKAVPIWLYDIKKVRDPRVNKQRRLRSVDRDTREHLLAMGKLEPDVREFLEQLQEYKHWRTLRGTFIDGLLERVQHDGRLHCEFPLHGTETGRLSSRNPNLQNQPRGPFIRQLYVAPENRCILSADYSQAELRAAAHLSGDANLIGVYAEKRDLHAESARKLVGDDFTKQQRDRAKRVNFGILYEQGSYSLSVQERMPQKEAQAYIDTFWTLYPDCRNWLSAVQNGAIKNGYATSEFGRKRRFPLITNDIKDEIKRQAGNFVVQSVASDFTLSALIRLVRILDSTRCLICITVHDSIIAECDLDYAKEAGEIIRYEMEQAPIIQQGWTDINFDVEVSQGPNWGYVEPWISM